MDFKKLKTARLKAKLKVAEVAFRLNVSTQTIYNWENGFYYPNSRMLEKLAKIYCKPIQYFFGSSFGINVGEEIEKKKGVKK